MARLGQVDPMGEAMANALLSTPAGQTMLLQIEEKAKAGVAEAASQNALNLMLFAVAGGAIGGTLFKGAWGTVAAVALAAWAGQRILENYSTPAQTHVQRAAIKGLAGLLHDAHGPVITIR